jgi:hypothetical protein
MILKGLGKKENPQGNLFLFKSIEKIYQDTDFNIRSINIVKMDSNIDKYELQLLTDKGLYFLTLKSEANGKLITYEVSEEFYFNKGKT